MWGLIWGVLSNFLAPVATVIGTVWAATIGRHNRKHLTDAVAQAKAEEESQLAAAKEAAAAKQKSFLDTLIRTRQIISILSELRTKVEGDRVTLYEFHNGGVFSNKNPIWRVVCTSEVHGPGVGKTEVAAQPIMASRMIELLDPLLKLEQQKKSACLRVCLHPCCDRRMVTIDVSQMESGYVRSSLEASGVHTEIITGIKDPNDLTCGFLAVDFCSFGHPIANPDAAAPINLATISRETCDCARMIEHILNTTPDPDPLAGQPDGDPK